MVGLDDVDDGLHERGRREELAVVVRALHGELHQEVFVDAPEHVAGGGAHGLRCRKSASGLRAAVFEDIVVLGQLSGQRLEIALDGVHRLDLTPRLGSRRRAA